MRFRHSLALALILVPAVVFGQSPTPSAAPAGPSAIVTVAVELWPETLDPAQATAGAPTVVAALFEPLVRFKPDSQEFDPATSLAARVSVAGDGLLWEIALKADLKFSDGSPLDAEAAAWSLGRLLKADHPARPANPAVPQSIKGVFKNILVRDKANLVIELTSAYGPLMGLLASPRAGVVAPSSFKDGKLAKVPVGAGAFVVKSEGKGRLELVPNQKFLRARPAAGRVDVVPAPPGPARLLWLLSGKGDLLEGLAKRDLDDLVSFPKIRVAKSAGLGMVTLYLNPNVAPFQPPFIREALIRGIPDELLSLMLYEARANVTRGFYPPWSWGSRGLFKPYGFDQVEAKRLIQTANIDRNGTAFVMWVVPPDAIRKDALAPFLESLRAALRELSISCMTEVVPRSELAKRMAGPNPQAILYWHEANLTDPDEVVTQCVHKDQPLAKFAGNADLADLQNLVVQARTREQPAAREFLYQQIEEKMVSALSTISLGAPLRAVAHVERIPPFKLGADGLVPLEDLKPAN